MKNIQKIAVSAAVVAAVFGFLVTQAKAMTPTFSISQSGGNALSVIIYGDANAPVSLYYNQNNFYLGMTDGNGYFSVTLNANNYTIPSGASVYVMVNNQQSPVVAWPNYYGNNNNYNYNYNYNNSASQSNVNVTIAVGQTTSVTAFNNSNVYVSSNSNSNVATATVNGNTISIYGNSAGSASLVVCNAGYNNNNCETVYVNVQPNNAYAANNSNQISSAFSLSASAVALNPGQNQAVVITSSSVMDLSINNSNPAVATVNASGNIITIHGNNPGSSTVLVCQVNSNNNCLTIPLTVNALPAGQVGGVYLNQVPYTGIGSGAKVSWFILGLFVWTGGVAYILVRRKMLAEAR